MLKLFRKNQFLRSLLLFPVALILNVNLLFDIPVDIPIYNELIDPWLLSSRTAYPVFHWLLLGMILFAGAVLINRMVIINRLSNTITLLPGLFYLLILSAFPLYGALTSVAISLLFFILLLSNILYINARTGVENKIFNVGIYLGILILLFIPNIILLVLVLIAINTTTTIKHRAVFNLLNGTFVPFYLIGIYLLLNNISFDSISSVYWNQFGFHNISLPGDIQSWITLIIMTIYILIVLLTYNNTISKKSIQSIRKINVLTWSMLFVILVNLISGVKSPHNLMLLVPALALYTSEGVLRFKRENNGELILIILIILCIVMPFIG